MTRNGVLLLGIGSGALAAAVVACGPWVGWWWMAETLALVGLTFTGGVAVAFAVLRR